MQEAITSLRDYHDQDKFSGCDINPLHAQFSKQPPYSDSSYSDESPSPSSKNLA
jgi:hypothetical protein